MKVKNPLERFFGAFLRSERTKMNLSTDEVAQKINLSDSLFRLMEAGSAPLHPSRAFAFIQAFPDAEINYDRLAKYLMAQMQIDGLIGEDEKSSERALDELGADNDFNVFAKRVNPYFLFNDDPKKQKAFLASTVVAEVKDFLNNKLYADPPTVQLKKTLYDSTLNMPSLTLKLQLDILEKLANHPPSHIGGIAQDWEEKNKDQFDTFSGLFFDSSIIITQENLMSFRFPYLNEPTFLTLNLLFLHSSKKEKNLRENFIEMLNESRALHNEPMIGPEEEKKINIRIINPTEHKDITKELFASTHKYWPDLQGYWMFNMRNGIQVGFVGVDVNDPRYINNLIYSECIKRNKLYQELIERLAEVDFKE